MTFYHLLKIRGARREMGCGHKAYTFDFSRNVEQRFTAAYCRITKHGGWMDRWMGGWVDGWIDGWKGKRLSA
jgi:hypothetical protein